MNPLKRLLAAVLTLAALVLAGCATAQPPAAAAPQADPREAMLTAVATCATAIERIATGANGDPASRVAAVGAIERMCGGGGAASLAAFAQPAPVQPQMGLGGHLWQAALEAGKIALQVYGIRANRDVGIVQSNNMAATTIAGYQTFGQMGGQIAAAGVAGYPYVQAPQANMTLSGTGVLGSGSYTGPVTTTTTTTRTCTGGAAGSANPPSVPGAGGAASC